jgi:hypothetical protein
LALISSITVKLQADGDVARERTTALKGFDSGAEVLLAAARERGGTLLSRAREFGSGLSAKAKVGSVCYSAGS